MNNKKIMSKKVYSILLLILFVIVVVFFADLSKYCTFLGDDSWYSIYFKEDEGFFDCLFKDSYLYHGGYYIGLFLTKFLSFGLPTLLGIHPADFISYEHGIIRGIFTAIGLYIITKFSGTDKYSKPIFLSLFLFMICYFFMNETNTSIIGINYTFYRYFFSLIFFGYFLSFIYKNIISYPSQTNKKSKNSIKLFFIILCGFVIGTSIEILFFTSVLFVSFIMLYNFILYLVSRIKNEVYEKYKYNLNINFYFPVLGLLIGTLMFTNTIGFQEVAAGRGLTNINITLASLKEFSFLYWNVCFFNESIYWIIFIPTVIFAFYFSIKNKEAKKILFPVFLEISILTVIFSLVLCGKTYDEVTRDRFFLRHCNIVFLYKMLIMIPFFMCFGYVFKNILKKIKQNSRIILSICLMVCLLCGSCCCINKIIEHYPYNTGKIDLLPQKRIYYIVEKMFRFYTLKNELPVLPNYYKLTGDSIYPYFKFIDINQSPIRNEYLRYYYLKIYKQDLKDNVQFVFDDNAFEKFYNKGGIIEDKELIDLDFSKLLDDDFVLNSDIQTIK